MDSATRARYVLACLASTCVVDCSNPKPRDPVFEVAFDASEMWLLNVWGPDGSDLVYAVGGTKEEGRLMRYDGQDWERVELDEDVPLLTWAWGFAEDDITIVGNEGTALHYDGDEWTLQPTPTEQNLWGVWGEVPDDLWAVGGRGNEEEDRTLLHFDGDTWEAVEVPELERAGVSAFFKVWGTSSDNVYVVGRNGAVLHFDGDEWSELLVGASDDLISLWGTGPDNIVAVGGRNSGVVSVFDGDEWRSDSLPRYPGLNGIWMRDPDHACVVGAFGTILVIDPATLELSDETYDTRLDLHGVFGSEERLFAVGGNFKNTVPPYDGIALWRPLD